MDRSAAELKALRQKANQKNPPKNKTKRNKKTQRKLAIT